MFEYYNLEIIVKIVENYRLNLLAAMMASIKEPCFEVFRTIIIVAMQFFKCDGHFFFREQMIRSA